MSRGEREDCAEMSMSKKTKNTSTPEAKYFNTSGSTKQWSKWCSSKISTVKVVVMVVYYHYYDYHHHDDDDYYYYHHHFPALAHASLAESSLADSPATRVIRVCHCS